MFHKSHIQTIVRKSAQLFTRNRYEKDPCFMFENENLLYHTRDKWGNIQVLEHDGQRVLSFGSHYEQSRMDMECPNLLVHHYTRAMLLGLVLHNPQHVTLFGLGGGCLLRAMHQANPAMQIHAVELRPAVVTIAQTYFSLPDSTNIHLHIVDGKYYIAQQMEASTDFIFADMYHALRADPFQLQKQFFQASQRILTAEGWLVINCHKYPTPSSSFLHLLKQYFPVLFSCPLPDGNIVFYAGKSPLKKSANILQLETELMEVKTRTPLNFLLKMLKPVD